MMKKTVSTSLAVVEPCEGIQNESGSWARNGREAAAGEPAAAADRSFNGTVSSLTA